MLDISVITPTADRPLAFALAERWMARQTVQPDEWIVADGGQTPVVCRLGQVYLHQSRPAGAENFAHNLLRAIEMASGEIVVIFEDDDYYSPQHLAQLLSQFTSPDILLAGDDLQRYYNVAHRCWRTFDNVGASLCQTALRREVLPLFEQTIRTCLARKAYGIDTTFWKAVPREQWSLVRASTALGIKGLPGQAGLGIGHRPTGPLWHPDPALTQLTAWLGEDAAVYAGYAEVAA